MFLKIMFFTGKLSFGKPRLMAHMWNTRFSNAFSVCRGNVLFLNLLFCRSSVIMFV